MTNKRIWQRLFRTEASIDEKIYIIYVKYERIAFAFDIKVLSPIVAD